MAVHASCVQAAVETSLAAGDATVVETIVAVDGVLLLGTLFPFVAAHLLACGVAIIRSAVLPQLVGWVAIGLAGTPAVVPGEVELPALLVWTLILSAGLLVANYPYVGARAGASPHDGV